MRRNHVWLTVAVLGTVVVAAAVAARSQESNGQAALYHSPVDVAYSPDGHLLAIADRTGRQVVIHNVRADKPVHRVPLPGRPGSVVWSGDGGVVYASEYETESVASIDAGRGTVRRRYAVGPYPVGVALVRKRGLLLAANTGSHDVSVIELSTGAQKARIPCVREPFDISVAPDESLAIVSNLLPAGSALRPQTTAVVSLLDLKEMKCIAEVKLPANTTAIRGTAVSPDGRWGYAVHTIGRTTLPATQLDRGWVNTNALSVIDLAARRLHATVLLDTLSEGAADPWGIELSDDGKTAWVSVAGTHQIARIDLALLHKGFAGELRGTSASSVWGRIKQDPKRRADLVNDLTALHGAGLISRHAVGAKGPRGLALSPDRRHLAVGAYFAGEVRVIDLDSMAPVGAIPLGLQPPADEARRGESVFHDASYTFQRWLSCATCHPNEARVDGLNWDLPNDGLGNPKNNKSLLYAHRTPPAMWLGVRDTMEVASAAGFKFAAFQPPAEDLAALQAYLRSLRPLRSPHRMADGELSERAKRGKLIFDSEKARCAHCHSGELFTNLQRYNVATQGPLDAEEHVAFDTPTLIELWRTAPYLHDGRAATLRDVFGEFNPDDAHGGTSQLSDAELDELLEYLLSL
jgi:DNA-binding beta-propeller fold protein YncE